MNIVAKTPDTGAMITMHEIHAPPSLEGFSSLSDERGMWYVCCETGTYLRSRYIAGRRVWWCGYYAEVK